MRSAPRRKNILSLLRRIWLLLFALSALAVMGYYIQQQDTRVLSSLTLVWSFFGAALLGHLGFWGLFSFAWQRLVFLVCGSHLSLLQGFMQMVIVTLGKYLPGKIWGMVARGAYLKRFNIKAEESLLLTLQEQLLMVHSAVVLSGILLGVLVAEPWAKVAAVLAVLSILPGPWAQRVFFILYAYLARKLKRSAARTPPRLLRTAHYLQLLLIYVGMWLGIGIVFSLLYPAFLGGDLDFTRLAWLLLANTMGITIGFFAFFAPGGIGVREAVTSLILSQIMPLESALLLSLVFRLWIVAGEILSAALVILLCGKEVLYQNGNS